MAADWSPPPGSTVTFRQRYSRCGRKECALCAPGARGHGPFWYARWHEGGRRHERYMGKELPSWAREMGAPAAIEPLSAPVSSAGKSPLATPAATPSLLHVHALGGFAVWCDGRRVPEQGWRRRRARDLFTCLLSAPGQQRDREQIAELLWPESDAETGRRTLRSSLWQLRLLLDGQQQGPRRASHIRAHGDLLALLPSRDGAADSGLSAEAWWDAAAFRQAARTALTGREPGAAQQALALFAGEYLPEDRAAEWTQGARSEIEQLHMALRLHLAELCEAHGERAAAEEQLRAVLAQDAAHEVAAARLMRLLASAERRGAALRVYQALAVTLDRELDVAPPAEMQALRAQLLLQESPPELPREHAQSAPRRGNLPAALTSFVGRAWEQGEVRRLLETDRLVTLTGAGGCGKTRLALVVAGSLQASYNNGVWAVDLAARAEGALVVDAIASSLGVREEPGRPLLTTLLAFLAPRRLLLLLDNCEHLVEACATLAQQLLTSCPALTILCTSRAALGVPGEAVWVTPGLTAPPAETAQAVELQRYEAVQLFVERARAVRPGFALTAAHGAAVAEICRQLEGIPLAIELAAARLSVLTVEQIVQRLDRRLQLLRGGSRAALPRHQTLRATLDWSYGLLTGTEQALLRRLAVFTGGWTLEAAETVCRGAEAGSAVLDLLSALVAKSLVQVEEQDGTLRYRMLEMVRQYGWERLEQVEETTSSRDHHLEWCVLLAEAAEPHLRGPAQGAYLAQLDREHDNLRAALRWVCESVRRLEPAEGSDDSNGEVQDAAPDAVLPRAEMGIRLGGACWWFWLVRGHLTEGRRWLERLLPLTHGADAQARARRARLLNGAGGLAFMQGDDRRATVFYEESLSLYRELGDNRKACGILHGLAHLARRHAEYRRAELLYDESLAVARELGDTYGMASSLVGMGNTAAVQGHYQRAQRFHEESLALWRGLGDQVRVATTLEAMGVAACYQGEYQLATRFLEEGVALARTLDYPSGLATALDTLGLVAMDQGDCTRAALLFEESLRLCEALGNQALSARVTLHQAQLLCAQGDHGRARSALRESAIVFQKAGDADELARCLESIADSACAAGHPAVAARLLGTAAMLRERLGSPRRAAEQVVYDRLVALLYAALCEAAFAAAWAAGQTLSQAQAVALATTWARHDPAAERG